MYLEVSWNTSKCFSGLDGKGVLEGSPFPIWILLMLVFNSSGSCTVYVCWLRWWRPGRPAEEGRKHLLNTLEKEGRQGWGKGCHASQEKGKGKCLCLSRVSSVRHQLGRLPCVLQNIISSCCFAIVSLPNRSGWLTLEFKLQRLAKGVNTTSLHLPRF